MMYFVALLWSFSREVISLIREGLYTGAQLLLLLLLLLLDFTVHTIGLKQL